MVFPYACEDGGKVVIMAAHMDTVFPEETPLGVREEGDKAFCPGIGDDTANLAVLLVLAAWFAQHAPRTEQGIVFVCNVCEEGLGNLKGTRALMRQWAARTVAFLSLDCTCEAVFHRAVGSKRYRVTAHTEGGHSFSAFGNTNAIEVIARLVQDIYALPVPQHAGSTTTYNVGLIEGGTSVNAIAQQASCVRAGALPFAGSRASGHAPGGQKRACRRAGRADGGVCAGGGTGLWHKAAACQRQHRLQHPFVHGHSVRMLWLPCGRWGAHA